MAAAKPAVVGGFILGALALAVVAILLFGGSRLFAHTSRVVVFFEGSVAGLEVGAPVTFRGVRVGSVQSVALRFSPSNMTALIPTILEFQPDKVIWEGQRLRDTPEEYKRLIDAGIIVDFRTPDVIRLGLSPLTTRFVDVHDGLQRLREML